MPDKRLELISKTGKDLEQQSFALSWLALKDRKKSEV